MLKNKKNRERIQQRQHLKDRDPHPTSSDVHVLQHTINIDTVPDPSSGARGLHGPAIPHGLPHGLQYHQQKTSPYQQSQTGSVHSAVSGEQSRHQRYMQQRTQEQAGANSYPPTNILQQQQSMQ